MDAKTKEMLKLLFDIKVKVDEGDYVGDNVIRRIDEIIGPHKKMFEDEYQKNMKTISDLVKSINSDIGIVMKLADQYNIPFSISAYGKYVPNEGWNSSY